MVNAIKSKAHLRFGQANLGKIKQLVRCRRLRSRGPLLGLLVVIILLYIPGKIRSLILGSVCVALSVLEGSSRFLKWINVTRDYGPVFVEALTWSGLFDLCLFLFPPSDDFAFRTLLVGVGCCCVLLTTPPALFFGLGVEFVGLGGFAGRFLGVLDVLGVCVEFLSTVLFFEVFLTGVAKGVICWVGVGFCRLPVAGNPSASSSDSSPESPPAKSSEESEDSSPMSSTGTAASIALVL